MEMKGKLMIRIALLVLLGICCTRTTATVTRLQHYVPDRNTWFLIQNRDTGKCLDVSGYPGTADRANVQTFQCEYPHRTNTDQVWRRDEYGRLVNQNSGKCLDVSGYRSSENRKNIQLYPCENPQSTSTDHIWDFEYEPTGNYVHIRNRYTDKCVDVSGYVNPGNNVNIQQFECEHYDNSNTDQWWQIIPVDGCI